MSNENAGYAPDIEEKKETKSFASFVLKEPRMVQEACLESISELIAKVYSENINPDTEVLRWSKFKIESVESLIKKIKECKSVDRIPNNYDEKEFVKLFYVWLLFADKREIVEENIKIARSKKLQIPDVKSWLPNKYELNKIAFELHDKGKATIDAFFLGNERANLFNRREIETIKKEMRRLEEERTKKEA